MLELAAGTGEVGFLAAEQIAPGGTLISSDFAPEMITAAQARAERLGIANVRFRQIDAEGIDQPAATLDGVLCRWGYMLMADGEAALQETRRVLKPGARVALAAWTGPSENPWASIPGSRARRARPPRAPRPERARPVRVGARGHDRGAPRGRGLRRARGRHRRLRLHASRRSTRGSPRSATSPRASASALDGLVAAEREDVLAAIREHALPYVQEDGSLVLPARTWVAAASA